jgi:hypothetical protein
MIMGSDMRLTQLETTNPTIVFGFFTASYVLSTPLLAWLGVAWLAILIVGAVRIVLKSDSVKR